MDKFDISKLEIDDKMQEMVCNFGAFGYDAAKISSILNCEFEAINSLMLKSGSVFRKYYQMGIDMSDYAIDAKLFELARNGDFKAMDKLEERQRMRKLEKK